MQTYQSTPDYYRDYIEHGWLKDQAAKVHKYINRWRNEAGKWVYQYKNELQDAKTRRNRKNARLNPYDVSFDINGKNYGAGPKGGIIAARSDDGRIKSYSYYSRIAARARSTDQRKNAIRAGRQRAATKGYNIKGYGGNLSSRGYSGSQGSGRAGLTKSGIDAGRIRSGRYIKGFSKRPGSRKKNIIYVYGRHGHANTQKGRSVTDVQDELAYIRLRNKIAAYNARKNRRAK